MTRIGTIVYQPKGRTDSTIHVGDAVAVVEA